MSACKCGWPGKGCLRRVLGNGPPFPPEPCEPVAAAVSATSTEPEAEVSVLHAAPGSSESVTSPTSGSVGAAVSPTPRPPTARQLAAAADTIRRYAATADLNDTDRGNLRAVSDDLGFAALASGRKE